MPTTRSPRARKPATDLGLAPEILWYLESRGIPLPTTPPLIQTPSPGAVRGARFDPARVDRVLKAFGQLRHTQGRWAGRPLEPDPWQIAYILAPVFGWVRFDREVGAWVRVVRSVWVELPRKNGKTTLSGGIALYLTAADGEPGAQVYAAAASERQAGYLFTPIRELASKSPGLSRFMKVVKRTISHPASMSTFTVISSVAEAMHGANVHGSVVDEVHVHKSADLIEAIETGTGSRTQPLNVLITTADSGKPGTIYARKRLRIEQLARRVLKDPTTYGVIWAAETTDDPFAEKTMRKANPGYGVSPTKAYLLKAAKAAQDSPAELASYLRLHLGIRTRQETKFFELEAWDRNAGMVDEEALAGRECYGGLDLSSTTDLTAWALLFPDDERGGYDALVRLFAPEARIEDLDRRTAGEASVWVKRGWLTLTPGNVVDYDFVRTQVNADREVFDVQSIGFDPWNSSQLVTWLIDDGATMVKVRQGYATMSPPTKELLRLLLTGSPEAPLLRHGGNGALRWMADNFTVATDAAGNVKPDKATAADHIDGISAIVTALTEAMTREAPARSAYEDGDLVVAD